MKVMRAKASAEEAAIYGQCILQLAERVARASGSGWFGFGEKISAKERAYLDELAGVVA